jgi:hypothetical protein
MDNMHHHYKILSWNVRGLNSLARQENVKQLISIYKPEVVCLQETKMSFIDDRIVRNIILCTSQPLELVEGSFWLPHLHTFSYRILFCLITQSQFQLQTPGTILLGC